MKHPFQLSLFHIQISQEAPVRECHMSLDLLDQDTVTGADQIYAPKVLSLEPLVAASYFARAAEFTKNGGQEFFWVFRFSLVIGFFCIYLWIMNGEWWWIYGSYGGFHMVNASKNNWSWLIYR